MADLSVDIAKLPDEIRDKLAELELELSEGKSESTNSGILTNRYFVILIYLV